MNKYERVQIEPFRTVLSSDDHFSEKLSNELREEYFNAYCFT